MKSRVSPHAVLDPARQALLGRGHPGFQVATEQVAKHGEGQRDAALSAQPADDFEVAFGPGPAPKATKSRKRTESAATTERKRKAVEAQRVRLDELGQSVQQKTPSESGHPAMPADEKDRLDALHDVVNGTTAPPVGNATEERARLDALAAAVNNRITPDNAVGF